MLENGPSSRFARHFDIDWEPVKPELRNKVLLPILGDQYGRVLERGEIRVHFEEGALHVRYEDQDLPVNPRQAVRLLRFDLKALRLALGEDSPHLREFLSVLTELKNLPPYTETDPERIAERQREKEVARERLARLVADAPRVRQHIDAALQAFNGVPGEANSFDRLHDLLEAQAYRLAYWRTAAHEINYRRFFDGGLSTSTTVGRSSKASSLCCPTRCRVAACLPGRLAVGGLKAADAEPAAKTPPDATPQIARRAYV